MKVFTILLIFIGLTSACRQNDELELGELIDGENVIFKKAANGQYGLSINVNGKPMYRQETPVVLDFFDDGRDDQLSAGYSSVKIEAGKAVCRLSEKRKASTFNILDVWTIAENCISVKRSVKVSGNGTGGFMSSITLKGKSNFKRSDAEFFVPGMIYGDPAHLTKSAIGGVTTKSAIQIREDRMPAPLFGALFKDNFAVCVFNPKPDATTTQEDSEDYSAKTLIDGRFKFGAMGANWLSEDTFAIGYWFPGSEGENTYAGNTYPGGQMNKWRKRYHEIKEGFKQHYEVIFRLTSKNENFTQFYTQAWRWAWQELKPQLMSHNIAEIKQLLLNMLGERAISKGGRTGFPQSIMGAKYEPYKFENKATLGFVGKNLEAAYFLLRDAEERKNSLIGAKHRETAISIIETFIKLPVSPPLSEGYDINDGTPRFFGEGKSFSTVYLRSYGDDMKSLLKAIRFERQHGREHQNWLKWVTSFANWLMVQQDKNGGFPRSWSKGKVLDHSTKTSYNPIPMFLLLNELTGKDEYKKAAIRAGEFVWQDGQKNGIFVGATIDNPDVIDKEAGTLSTEAYLALYQSTKDKKWISRAKAAANYAETWIYLWQINPPVNSKDSTIGLKSGMTTVGNQLISTGHSLTDNYMAFDVDEYEQLYMLTNDKHYHDVARILLHNTKSWISTPGHPYDMKGYGWQQEHWSLAPHRGHGMHRRWLPWVTTSQLNGIFGLQDLQKDINLSEE